MSVRPTWRRTFSVGRSAVHLLDCLRCREHLTLLVCL